MFFACLNQSVILYHVTASGGMSQSVLFYLQTLNRTPQSNAPNKSKSKKTKNDKKSAEMKEETSIENCIIITQERGYTAKTNINLKQHVGIRCTLF